jgi:threonine aldolase
MQIIDLRSDTVTKPSNEMRQYMIDAEVGDDVYGEDPTVNNLQEEIAMLFGKEASLFVPSGTMSNQISLKILTEQGDEVITDADAHIFYYETAAPSIISNIQIRPIKSNNGMPDLNLIEDAIRQNIYYFPKTKVISIENTHNRFGGKIIDIKYIKEIKNLANKYNIFTHLDGARIWNAHIATGIKLDEYAKYFDTISVCLSKGLGAPIGSLIISNRKNIEKAIKWRKILGGGMRQVGIIAAAGIYAIRNNLKLLIEDHKNAKFFANLISNLPSIYIDINSVETNIVIFKLSNNINTELFVSKCKQQGLLLSSIGQNTIRVVFHLDINNEMMYKSYVTVKKVIEEIN